METFSITTRDGGVVRDITVDIIRVLARMGHVTPSSLATTVEGRWIKAASHPTLASALNSPASEGLKGDLAAIPPPALMVMMEAIQSTGKLIIAEASGLEIQLFFQEGKPVHGQSNQDARLVVQALVRRGIITEQQATVAVQKSPDPLKLLLSLQNRGSLSDQDVQTIRSEAASKLLLEAIKASEGTFTFSPLDQTDSELITIKADVPQSLRRGLKDVKGDRLKAFLVRWRRFRPKINTVQQDARSSRLSEEERNIIQLATSCDSLTKLLKESERLDDTMRLVYYLYLMGVIDFTTEKEEDDLEASLRTLEDKSYLEYFNLPLQFTPGELKDVYERETARFAPAEGDTPQREAMKRRILDLLVKAHDTLSNPVARGVYQKVEAMGLNPKDRQTQEYVQREINIIEAQRNLRNRQWADAEQSYQQLIRLDPEMVDARVALAWIKFQKSDNKENAAREAISTIETLLTKAPDLVDGFLYIGLMSKAVDDMAKARESLERVLKLQPHNETAWAELRDLVDTGKGKKKAKSKDREIEIEPTDIKWPLILTGGLMAVLFVVFVLTPLGEREGLYVPSDLGFYIRRILLVAAALVGTLVFRKESPLKWGFGAAPAFSALGLLAGAAIGFFSPRQNVASCLGPMIGLIVFTAIAEEVFFRGYLTKSLLDAFTNKFYGVVISALFYGLYQVTFFSFFHNLNFGQAFLWILIIAAASGFPLAFLYFRSKSLIPPILCHLAAKGVMMGFSISFLVERGILQC